MDNVFREDHSIIERTFLSHPFIQVISFKIDCRKDFFFLHQLDVKCREIECV